MTKLASPLVLIFVFLMAGLALSGTLKRALIADPSVSPPDGNLDTNIVRIRSYGDINFDGFTDILVSSDDGPSQNGYPLFIFLGDSTGKYWLYDTTFNFPERLHFEHDGAGIRMWSSWNMGGGEVIMGYDILTDTGLIASTNLTIYPNDGGGSISQAIMAAMYEKSEVKLVSERYRIVKGEAVIWKD